MNEDIVFIENGRKRKGEKASCLGCGVEYIRRKSGSNGLKVYCSPACARQATRRPVALTCAMCQKEFTKSPSKLSNSKSGLMFCSLACKHRSQHWEHGIDEAKPGHYGTGENYKLIAYRAYPAECMDCGEQFFPILVVHHKDGDRSNNKVENLEVLCQNHHAIRHMQWLMASGLIGLRP
jgi:hypothetical protein